MMEPRALLGNNNKLTGLATSAVTVGEITALDHELLDNTVEGGALVTKALLARGERAEVLSRLGDRLAIEAKDDAAELLVAVLNVEVDLVGDLGALGSLGSAGKEEQAHHQDNGGGNEPPEAKHGDFWIQQLRRLRSRSEADKNKLGDGHIYMYLTRTPCVYILAKLGPFHAVFPAARLQASVAAVRLGRPAENPWPASFGANHDSAHLDGFSHDLPG